MKLAAGIDIGGTHAKFGIVDKQGNCLSMEKVSTQKFKNPRDFAGAVTEKIIDMVPPKAKLKGIGIGAPNGNFYKGTIEYPPNLPWKGITPMAKLFKKESQIRSVLTNDANAAALGEMNFGGAKKMSDFIFVTLGTGLGSGIVANRKLIYGHDGMAAELGHIIAVKNGRKCNCGRKGCLETYVSVTGLKRTVKEWLHQGRRSMLSGIEKLHTNDIFSAAGKGDALALEAFEFTGEILGLSLANSVVYTSPKAIFLFGGLTNAKQLLFEPTQRHFEKNLMRAYKGKIKILPSKLKKNHAAVLGAASLVWKDFN